MAQDGNFSAEQVDLSRLVASFCSFKGNSLTNRIKGEAKKDESIFKITIRNDRINDIVRIGSRDRFHSESNSKRDCPTKGRRNTSYQIIHG